VPRRRSDRAIYLVTGPMAAGKSTVARLLAERFVRGVHVEGDAFRRSIVSGRVEMTPDLAPEALRQLRLRCRLGATVADAYFEAGYAVALEDVVAGPPLADYAAAIRGCPLHVVVLLPSAAVVAARAAARRQGGYGRWSIDELYRGFTAETPRIGIWLDTSEQTPAETVEAILARTPPVAEPVVVTDYDPAWPRRFEERAASIRAALGDLAVAVEHAGSTAVPASPPSPCSTSTSSSGRPGTSGRRSSGCARSATSTRATSACPAARRSRGRRARSATTSTSWSPAGAPTRSTSGSATTCARTPTSRATTPR
jgi:chloramphenicol 3-O-phosphotransferase